MLRVYTLLEVFIQLTDWLYAKSENFQISQKQFLSKLEWFLLIFGFYSLHINSSCNVITGCTHDNNSAHVVPTHKRVRKLLSGGIHRCNLCVADKN